MSEQLFAVEEGGIAGQIVFWRLSGTVDPDVLGAAWEKAGLDPADQPELPKPSTALTRALKGLQRGRRLVRPLDGRGGYAIVSERAQGDELDYSQEVTVKVDAVGRLVFSDAEHRLAPTVRAAYGVALNEFDTEDVAAWLVRYLRARCDAVSLRDSGGFYYVPPARSELWDTVAGAVRAASSHKIFRVPALASKDVVDAVLDAVEREARDEAEAMLAEVDRVTADGKGVSERVGTARLGRCDAVEAKVARYEALLGTRLESIRERLADLRASLASAMLAEGAAEAAE